MTDSKYLDKNGKRRVVITGIGVISPIGNTLDEFWENLVNGICGASEVTKFDTSQFRSHIACEVKNFNFEKYCSEDKLSQFSKVGGASHYSIAASSMAIDDAGLNADMGAYRRERIGVSLGTTMGEAQVIHEIASKYIADGFPDTLVYRHQMSCNIPANVAKYFHFQGPNSMIPTACASGNYSIGRGCDLIRGKRADLMIVGGVDPIDSVVFAGFSRIFSMAPHICQPFDKKRKGILVGEGAGILLLESLEGALNRKAKIYAELIGYGLSCDAYHMTNPDPSVSGTKKSLKAAFRDAKMHIEKVDCVMAHGTGTPANDKAETKLIKEVFGETAYNIPVSANKSMLGHTMGAAAVMNAISACMIFKHGEIPPTINYSTKDPDCDLDYVTNHSKKMDANLILSNAFAFGGNNTGLLLKRWE